MKAADHTWNAKMVVERDSASHEPTKTWMRTIESSVAPVDLHVPEMHPIEISTGGVFGWLLAFFLFLALTAMQLRARRQSRFLIRGGERDFSILPPARNRRSRPR